MPNERASKSAFIIMPFSRELDWLRHEIISACVDEGVQPHRGDDVFTPGSILSQILEDIDSADIIFAVCTGKNANVFFELGYAWTKHDPILIAEDVHDLPFDIASHRVAMYGQSGSSGSRETLKWRLQRAIRAVLDKERIPTGRVLSSPPAPKAAVRLSATLMDSGRSYRLVVANTGTVEVKQVMVTVPPEASSFHLLTSELPIDVLRPGESAKLMASVVMGGGKSIFDIEISGLLNDGSPVTFPVKISI